MLKKLLLATVCAVSLSAAFEVFAMDKALKAVSGEVDCPGFMDSISLSGFAISNFDPSHSVSITKIKVYKNDGSLMQEMSPAGFPTGFKAIMPPFSSNEIYANSFFPDTKPGSLVFRIYFASTDGTLMLAPHIYPYYREYSSSSQNSVVGIGFMECTYTSLSNK